MIEIIRGSMRGRRSFEGQLYDRFIFLSIAAICIRQGVRGIGCCISLFRCSIRITRSLMRTLRLPLDQKMEAAHSTFYRLRFASTRPSSGSQLISGDL